MTVTITTDTPNAAMLDALSVMWIVQKAVASARFRSTRSPRARTGPPRTTRPARRVQGTGPFLVTAYTAGQFMELTANDGYWRGTPHPRQDRPQGIQGPGDRARSPSTPARSTSPT